MMGRTAFAAGFVAALFSLPSHAAIVGTCTITVLNPGTLATSPAINVLGSNQAGGNAAQVRVKPASVVCIVLQILDCYSVSVPPPAEFLLSPAGGEDGVTYASTYSVDGAAPVNGASATTLGNGIYILDVDVSATRAAGVFPAGDSQAQVTVRCE
jgi:hypothetical protein